MRGDHHWPKMPLIIVCTIIAALCSTVAVAIEWRLEMAADERAAAREQETEDRRLCERSVNVRGDNRAMWEWLIEAVRETSALAGEAQAQLDALLPPLRCDANNQPVPAIED